MHSQLVIACSSAVLLFGCFIDAPTYVLPTDASVDANGFPDSQVCPSPGKTLMDDPLNCGACGYRVVGGRTCENGKPHPGWVRISNPPSGAIQRSDYSLAAWTGVHLLVVKTDNAQLEYDPETDVWTELPGLAALITPLPDGWQPLVAVPSRKQLFVWGNTSNGVALQIFTDDGASPSWATAPNSGTPPRLRDQPALAYLDGYVYVVFGSNDSASMGALDNGDRYDVNAMMWQPVPADATFGSSGTYTGRDNGPLAVVGNVIVTFGGQTNQGYLNDRDAHILDAGTLTWRTPIAGSNAISVTGNTFVSSQGVAISFGGRTSDGNQCETSQTLLVDPSAGTMVTATPPPLPKDPTAPMQGLHESWAFDLGRSVMVWGGLHVPCAVGSPVYFDGGSLGVFNADRTGISWVALPADTQSPTAQANEGVSYTQGNTQQLWTGKEAIVWGGADAAGTTATGSRYQPPVACVCPSSQVTCDSVSQIADATCDPTGQ